MNNRVMKPDVERSEQVIARVVAWHNRHPLAERISAAQVHSVGVVSLPFAVHGARVDPLPVPEPGPPAPMPDLASGSPTAGPASAAPAAPESKPEPEPEPDAVSPGPLPVSADADVAVEAVVEIDVYAAEPEPVADPAPESPTSAPGEGTDAAVSVPSALASEQPEPEPPIELFAPPAATTRVAVLPARPRSWRLLTWWRSRRGRGPFHALFSEDFIAPLRPRQVAGFVADHGAGHWPLEPEAPQRSIALDRRRLRSGDSATEVELHVITAAIGVGESRLRVLLEPGAGGRIVGPRHWSRARVAAASVPAALLLLGAGVGFLSSGEPPAAQQVAAVLAAASAASASSAPLSASSAATATLAIASSPASSPASAAVTAPAASAPVLLAAVAASEASASAPLAPAGVALPASTGLPAAADKPAAPATAALAGTLAASVARPSLVKAGSGRLELPPLIPRLAESDRHALRQAGQNLRSVGAAAVPAKAWALATRPADKEPSERAAAQLKALALLQPVPMRAELLQARNGWRAVFWPFVNAQDAEKARLALADKGLSTEVIEF